MSSADYAREVHDLLTSGLTQTRPANAHPLLSEEEGEEMVGDFLLDVPAKVFAAKLEGRDIAAFESAIDRADEERPIGGALPQGARGAPWAELTASLAPDSEEPYEINSEANSYGLRCLVCGEFETACSCEVE